MTASRRRGSNLGPNAKGLIDRVTTDAAAARKDGVSGEFPADMLTASGSGLDPHISPDTAYAQVDRVARARGHGPRAGQARLSVPRSRPSLAGVLGEPRVNVLRLNRRARRRHGATVPRRIGDRPRPPRPRGVPQGRRRRGARQAQGLPRRRARGRQDLRDAERGRAEACRRNRRGDRRRRDARPQPRPRR